jgi:starch synthase
LAHKITAGSDIFLMPSRYEPCGLTQIHSMRYGTVPVVRATGGLEDSVADEREVPKMPTGFKFVDYTEEALLDCIERALRAFRRPAHWRTIRENGMRADFSWERSAMQYIELYRRLATGTTAF